MGNLIAIISDHLPQFAIIPNMICNISGKKSNIYERDWFKFDREDFILDYFCWGEGVFENRWFKYSQFNPNVYR